MRKSRSTLSEPTIAILEMIAAGSNYDQILAAYPKLKHWDIRIPATKGAITDNATWRFFVNQ